MTDLVISPDWLHDIPATETHPEPLLWDDLSRRTAATRRHSVTSDPLYPRGDVDLL